MEKKVLLKNLAASVFGIVLFLSLFELALLFFFPQSDLLHELDVIGGKFIPNIRGMHVGEEFVVQVKANSLGFRDEEHEIKKPGGVKRIVVLGDSFAEALQVPLEETFARRLEEKLNEGCAGNFEVINLGISGFGPANYFLALKHYGMQFHPDLVVVAFYPGNDVDPAFLVDGKRNPYNPEISFEEGKAEIRDIKHGIGFLGSLKALAKRTYVPRTYLFIADKLRRFSANLEIQEQGIPDHLLVFKEEYDERWAEAWSKTKAILSAIKEEAGGSGAGMLIMSIPFKLQLSEEQFMKALEAYKDAASQQWDLMRAEKELEEFSKENGIEFLSLPREFSVLPENERLALYYQIDGHFNKAGHEATAEALFGKMKEIGVCIPREGAR